MLGLLTRGVAGAKMLGFASASGSPRAEAGTLFVKSVGFRPRQPEKPTRWSQEWARGSLMA